MGYDSSIFSKGNTFNPSEIAGGYQKGLTEGMDRQAQGMNLSNMAMQLKQNQQNFSDQQAQRQALQQNVNEQGQLNGPAAVSQVAKVNPMMAQQLDKMIRQSGIDQTHQKMEEANDFWAKTSPETWQKDKQEMIDRGHPEFANLPDVYMDSVRNKGLIGSLQGKEQLGNMMAQRKYAVDILSEYAKKGVVGPQSLYDAAGFAAPGQMPKDASQKLPPKGLQAPAGLQPGESIPMGERDLNAQKVYDETLSNRKLNDPAYANSGNNLLAVQNAMRIFDKHKDLNNINTLEQHILAGEAAKAIKGGNASPTQDEVAALLPENAKSRGSEMWAKITSKPVPTNNAEYYQILKDYFGELKANSMNAINVSHELAGQNALAAGINKDSLKIKSKARSAELQGLASGQYKEPPKEFGSDVLNYAKTHNITPDQAQQIKIQRSEKRK